VIKTIWRSLRSSTKLTHNVPEASSLPRVEDANLSYYFVIADKIKLNQNIMMILIAKMCLRIHVPTIYF